MSTIYVARSVKLSRWASDVGLGKHVYKVGICDDDPKTHATAGWAGESDWKVVKNEEIEGLDEAGAIERLAAKEKMIDPRLYPKLKGALGVFRLTETKVENSMIVARALAGGSDKIAFKLKPADFATYLINNARR
ncbi:MAG TPA: hypothetical protein VGG57_23550 [Stellaceae bacterium]|jgi:hypothetical protein